jgi:hypothetical protein
MAPLFVDSVQERTNTEVNLLYNPAAHVPVVEHKMMYSAGVSKKLPRVPQFLKPIIAQAAQFESQQAVAAAFQVSQPTVSALANGFDDVNKQRFGNPNPDLLEATKSKVTEVHDLAIDCLISSLGVIQEKLPDAKLSEATQAANVTSSVVERLAPKAGANLVIGQVIVNAPLQSDMNAYGAPIEVESKRIE